MYNLSGYYYINIPVNILYSSIFSNGSAVIFFLNAGPYPRNSA